MNIQNIKGQMVVNKGVIHFHQGYTENTDKYGTRLHFNTYCGNAQDWSGYKQNTAKLLAEALPTDEELMGYKVCSKCAKSPKITPELQAFLQWRKGIVSEAMKSLAEYDGENQ